MFLDERISLYEEILEQDPSSKLFFQLAKLYVEKQEIEKGICVLTTGLDRNPEHLEARLFLIDLLNKKDSKEQLHTHIDKVDHILSSYPCFWKIWANSLAKKGDRDLAGLVLLIGYLFESDKKDTIGDILYSVLNNIEDRNELLDAKETTLDTTEIQREVVIEEEGQGEIEFKTKTMGDILMSQGDYRGALEIYEELLNKTSDSRKKTELELCIQEAKKNLTKGVAPSFNKQERVISKKKNLLSRLRLLAQRLEARAC